MALLESPQRDVRTVENAERVEVRVLRQSDCPHSLRAERLTLFFDAFRRSLGGTQSGGGHILFEGSTPIGDRHPLREVASLVRRPKPPSLRPPRNEMVPSRAGANHSRSKVRPHKQRKPAPDRDRMEARMTRRS